MTLENIKLWTKLAMLSLMVSGFVQGQQIKSGPGNIASKLGETAVLHCDIDYGPQKAMTWYFNDDIIYSIIHGDEDYPHEKGNYLVKTDDQGSTLIVKHLRYDDGGTYSCHAADKEGTGSLVVLGTPSLDQSTLVENENAWFSCEVGFGGPEKDSISAEHYPELLMFMDGILLDIPTTENHQELSKIFNTKAEAVFDGKMISCEIRTSTNSVTSEFIMNVLHSVRNTSFSPQQETIEIGSNLNCTARGYPPPSLEWENEGIPGKIIHGQLLTVTQDMKGMNKWRCTARNTLGGVLYQDSVSASFEAVAPPDDNSPIPFVLIGIGLVILTIVGIVFGIVFIRRKKKRGQRHEKAAIDYGEDIPLKTEDVETQLEKDQKIAELSMNLRDLIFASEYVIEPKEQNEWSEDLILKVKKLLDDGADPNWISLEDLTTNERSNTFTAQYKFFTTIVHILLFKGELFAQIKDLVSLFLSEKSSNSQATRGTALHALVELDWEWLCDHFEQMPKSMLLQYHEIIDSVTKIDATLLDEINWNGRTPLHLFLHGLRLQPCWLDSFTTIVHCLKSDKNINTIDNEQNSILHHIAEAFPMIGGEISADSKEKIFHFIETVTSATNIDFQNETKSTALHILADKYTGEIHDNSQDFLSELIKRLSSSNCNVDIQDHQGCTISHLLMHKYPIDDPEESANAFIELMKHLNKKSKRKMKDHEGNTILHILAKKYNKTMSVGHHNMFCGLLKALSESNCNVDIQDKDGRTVLHLLVGKYPIDVPEHAGEAFIELMEHFMKRSKGNIQDHEGYTVLHILANNYEENLPVGYHSTVFQLVKIFQRKTNPRLLDRKKCTVLHILATRCSWKTSEVVINNFKEIMTCLLDDHCKDFQNDKERTVLHILINNYNRKMPAHCIKIFEELVKVFMTPTNITFQDDKGQTIFHNLVAKYPTEVPKNQTKSFFDLANVIASRYKKDVADKKGCTVLHLLAGKYPKDVPELSTMDFFDLMKHLTKKFVADIQDLKKQTTLHILANNYNENMSEGHLNIFLELVKLLKPKSNPCLLDCNGSTVLHILASKCSWITSEIVINTYNEIMTILLDESCKDIQNDQGSTILHIMIKTYRKKIPAHCHKVFENLTKILTTSTNINVQDKKGRTILHTLVEKYPTEVSKNNTEAFLELVKYIASRANRDIADKDGCTVLHMLLKEYNPKTEARLKGKFVENVKMLKSGSNINVQDAHGQTPLHVVLKTMFYYQHLGQDLLPTIEVLTSGENVNMPDEQSITPYSWALQGMEESTGRNSKFSNVFVEIELVFIRRGADIDQAKKGCSFIQNHRNTLWLDMQ